MIGAILILSIVFLFCADRASWTVAATVTMGISSLVFWFALPGEHASDVVNSLFVFSPLTLAGAAVGKWLKFMAEPQSEQAPR